MKEFLLMPSLNLPWHCLRFCPLLSLTFSEKKPTLTSYNLFPGSRSVEICSAHT